MLTEFLNFLMIRLPLLLIYGKKDLQRGTLKVRVPLCEIRNDAF